MSERAIDFIYIIKTIIVFIVVWSEEGAWWQGLIGVLVFGALGGVVHGILNGVYIRSGAPAIPKYPFMFVAEACLLGTYYL